MINSKLRHYYFNIFLTLAIGTDKFRLLVSTHIQKMTASGVVEFAPLILEMQTEGDLLNDIVDKKTLDFSGRHVETTGKDESIVDFNEFVTFLYNQAAAKFRLTPAKLEEIFPQGVTYFTEASTAEFATRLSYLGTKVTKYATDLTAPVVAEFAAHKLAIETTMALQLAFKSELGSDSTDYAKQRVKVCKLLHKDALLITGHFYEEPETVENFFDQTIWQSHPRSTKGVIDFLLAPTTYEDTSLSFITTTKMEFTNNSNFAAGYIASPVPLTEMPTTWNAIPANGKIDTTGTTLGAPAMKYIYIINPSATDDLDLSIKVTQ